MLSIFTKFAVNEFGKFVFLKGKKTISWVYWSIVTLKILYIGFWIVDPNLVTLFNVLLIVDIKFVVS